MAVTINYSARFPAGTVAGDLYKDRVGIITNFRRIIGFPITKAANETITSITLSINLSRISAWTDGANYSWFVGLLDNKYETTSSYAAGDQVISKMETCCEKVSFKPEDGSNATRTHTIVIDNIYWTGDQTTKYVYLFNIHPYNTTHAYSEFTINSVTLSNYSTAISSQLKLRGGLSGFSGTDRSYTNKSQYVGYGSSNGSALDNNCVFKFCIPEFPGKIEYMDFKIYITSISTWSSPTQHLRWAITTSDANIYNYRAGVITDENQIANGEVIFTTADAQNLLRIQNVNLTPNTVYYLILWGYGPQGDWGYNNKNGNAYSTVVALPNHSLTIGGSQNNTINYNANGYGTAPEAQVKAIDTSITLQPFISNQIKTGYKVTFNANGGTCTTNSLTSQITYNQVYWNTKSDGSGVNYMGKAKYSKNEDITLYAIWNSTNGSITLPTPTRENYVFKGWATTADAESSFTEIYTPISNITLYAIWKPAKVIFIKVNGIWKTK